MTVQDRTAEIIRVLIADSSAIFRSGMRQAIEACPDLEIVGEASDLDEMAEVAAREKPSVVVVGVPCRGASISEAISIVAGRPPAGHPGAGSGEPVGVLAITDLSRGRRAFEIIGEAFEAGAAGCLDRAVVGEELVYAIRAVFDGRSVASSEVTRALVEELSRLMGVPAGFEESAASGVSSDAGSGGVLDAVPAGRGEATPGCLFPRHPLTARESEVLSLLACGKGNRDIAGVLSISEKTAKNHVSSILRKLGAKCRTEAAIWAVSRGFSRQVGRKAYDQ